MKYILVVFLMSNSVLLHACDICSAFSRIKPNDFRHSLGIHINHLTLEGEIPSGLKHLGHLSGLYSTDVIRETYTRIELRGRYRVSDRFSFYGIIPYKVSTRTQNEDLREQSDGFGDPISFVEYRPFLPLSKHKLKFLLNLRGGVKFPLGSTAEKHNDIYLDHDFQPGSGSYDLFLGSEAYIGSENLGLVVSQLYRYNRPNLSDFKYGNVYSALGLMTKRWRIKDTGFSAAAGVQFENKREDEQDEMVSEGTQSDLVSLAFRVDFNYNKFEVYGFLAQPMSQNFEALKTLPTKQLLQVGINYLIETK